MRHLILFFVPFCFIGCKSDVQELPFIGQSQLIDGKESPYTIPDWTYMNADSTKVSNQDLSNYIYLTDFFFTSCPSICPKVMKEMLRLQDEFRNDPRVKLVSFTLDPKRDKPSKLKKYASNIGADQNKWLFLWGDKDDVYDLANAYFVVAYPDDEVPGGFDHSGKIILVDKEGHIRSFSEGTDPSETPKLIADTRKLLASYEKER